MTHTRGVKASSLGLLAKLPKLSELIVYYSFDSDQSEYLPAISIFGQLPHLTRLSVENNYSESEADFKVLTNLTGLLDLSLDSRSKSADFESFLQLTKLIFRPRNQTKSPKLPMNLREFHLSPYNLDSEAIDMICSLELLKSLHVRGGHIDYLQMSHVIINLTALTELSLPHVPLGIKKYTASGSINLILFQSYSRHFKCFQIWQV